ncbi:MAG: secondary thiamine-phosphate synthase enzyme YjbQ [Acidobacteria bacterium]|nr:secondary thiamine-phosphate synthase enzyme YjbQ [Acidobacteriota bacterium]
MKMISFDTTKRTQVIDITQALIEQAKLWGKSGIINVYCPHTTAGLTIQENYDPSVKDDILNTLERLVPQNFAYRHTENNADAHIKSVLCGVSITVPVSNGHLLLGRWQGVLLLELDGPRKRQVYLTFIEGEEGK